MVSSPGRRQAARLALATCLGLGFRFLVSCLVLFVLGNPTSSYHIAGCRSRRGALFGMFRVCTPHVLEPVYLVAHPTPDFTSKRLKKWARLRCHSSASSVESCGSCVPLQGAVHRNSVIFCVLRGMLGGGGGCTTLHIQSLPHVLSPFLSLSRTRYIYTPHNERSSSSSSSSRATGC